MPSVPGPVKLSLIVMEIRQARHGDVSQIRDLADGEMCRQLSAIQVEQLIDSGIGLVAEIEGRLVGLINGQVVSRQLRIFNILVARDLRGQGLGARLLLEFERAHPECTSMLALYSPMGPNREQLTAGLAFYERSGFYVVSSNEESCVLVKPLARPGLTAPTALRSPDPLPL